MCNQLREEIALEIEEARKAIIKNLKSQRLHASTTREMMKIYHTLNSAENVFDVVLNLVSGKNN